MMHSLITIQVPRVFERIKEGGTEVRKTGQKRGILVKLGPKTPSPLKDKKM